MKRALTILLGALILALALAAATLVFLGATESGTRFLAGQAERLLPVTLEEVSGAILGEVRVGRLVTALDAGRLEITELEVAVQMLPLLFDNRLVVDSAVAQLVHWTGSGTSEPGPPPELALPYLPLSMVADRLLVERLEVDDVFPMRIAASAALLADGLELRSLEITSDVLNLTADGTLGTGSNPTLVARVEWSVADSPWQGQGTVDGRVESLTVRHTLRGPVSGTARGTGSLAVLTEPAVDIAVSLDDLELGDTAIRSIAGRLTGTLANLRADAGARVHTPGLEPFPLIVEAYGPVTGPVTVRNTTAAAAGGSLDAQGSVSWSDGVRVRLGGSLNDIALGVLYPGLSGSLASPFGFTYDDGRLSASLAEISGSLEGRPLAGEVAVTLAQGEWWAGPVRLSVGENRLSGDGRLVDGAVELTAEIAAPDLGALDLGVSGDLAGRVEARGVWPDLSGRAELSSSRVAAAETELEGMTLQADMRDGVLQASLEAALAQRDALAMNDVRLGAAGTLEALDWNLGWRSGSAEGTLRRGDGTVLGVQSFLVTALDREFALRSPTELRLADGRVSAAPACFAGADASACLEQFVFADGRIETRGELSRAPVGLAQLWLPVRLADGGYVEGRWTLAGEPGDLAGELNLAARELAFVPAAGGEAVDLPDLEASGTVGAGRLDARLAATGEGFTVVGDVGLEPLAVDGRLQGLLEVAVADLAPLRVFDQRLGSLGGAVNGDLEVSGTPRDPRAEGRFRLRDGAMQLNDPDIALSAVQAQLRLEDTGTFELTGSARQEEDTLQLSASGSGLFGGDLTLVASLEGQGIRARHPDWEVTVSPDLDFDYGGGRGRVRGRVGVPQAEVRLSTLPSSVPTPSEDVVVVGREQQSEGAQNRLRVDVDVVLGEDVSLKALGLTAELEGTLRARLDDQGRTSLRGTLDVTGGVLSTQGQTLTIESGTVVYNGPVTRPYIDIRAVRVIEDVTPEVKVGLHIRGDADNLTSSVFSEPPMSETRALSFLVLGRDIEEETADDDGNRLMAAAINLGLSRSKGLTSELKRMTGLDELSAMAETQNSFAIVAGKRISDDLYVRYTYNTFSAVGAFLVRYELTDRWQLEAQSGEQSSMDLMYSVEK